MLAGSGTAAAPQDLQQILGTLAGLFASVTLPALPYAEQLAILAADFPTTQHILPLAFASQLLCQLLTGQTRLSSLDGCVPPAPLLSPVPHGSHASAT